MDASTVSAIADCFLVALTAYAVYVARKGLVAITWKEQKGFERELAACRRLEDSVRLMRGQLHMLFAAVETARLLLGHIAEKGAAVGAQAEFVKTETHRFTANLESIVFDCRAAIGEIKAVWGDDFFESWTDMAHVMMSIASHVRETGVLGVAVSHELGPIDSESAKSRARELLVELAGEGTEKKDGELNKVANNLKSMEGYINGRLQKIHRLNSEGRTIK